MLTLASDVSQAYFELLGLRLQLEIAKQTTQSYTATLQLFTDRLQEGLGNALQTSRAAADLASAAASIPELERQIALKENQINVLLGKNPASIETKPSSWKRPFRPPSPRAYLPLCWSAGRMCSPRHRRCAMPTPRSASPRRRTFRAIGLTTFFGKLSTPLADLSSGNTNAWSLAANASGPIFRAAPSGPATASGGLLGTDHSTVSADRVECFSGCFRCPDFARAIRRHSRGTDPGCAILRGSCPAGADALPGRAFQLQRSSGGPAAALSGPAGSCPDGDQPPAEWWSNSTKR